MTIFILLILFPVIVSSQSPIGTYKHIDGMTTHQIQLLDSAKFIKSSWTLQSHSVYREKGHYSVHADTLFFELEPYVRPNGEVTIIERETLKGIPLKGDFEKTTWINLQLFEINDTVKPLNISFIDLVSNDSVIATVRAFDEGKFDFLSSNTVVDHLILRSFGYDNFSLSLDEYRGFTSKLRVSLVPNSNNYYSERIGTDKYLIGKDAEYIQFLSEGGPSGPKYLRIPKEN